MEYPDHLSFLHLHTLVTRLPAATRHPATPQVDMKFGFFFDSFRAQFYYWESVILLEKLAAVVALTATQRLGAAPQVLAAHLVLFGALLLQFCYHPYACNMLDSLQVSKAGRGHFRAGLGLTSLL
jgi:hypothetical protein